MKNIFILTSLILFSCHDQRAGNVGDSSKKNQNESLVPGPTIKKSTFLDSVFSKLELSIDQVRKYTQIDSIYYTGLLAGVSFTGDTVFSGSNGFKMAIIDYDDRKSCIYKFLLVFDVEGNQNLDGKIVYTDCDRDGTGNYQDRRYKVINDSTFEVTENSQAAKTGSVHIKKAVWIIGRSGHIEATH